MNRRWSTVTLVAALSVMACSPSTASDRPASSVSPSPVQAPFASSSSAGTKESFTPADVDQAIASLASIGVEVRVAPSDAEPIMPPVGPLSPVRFLRTQVRNMALESAAGGGLRGTDLDAASLAAGGGPVSALVAGWAAEAGTPTSSLGGPLIRGQAADDPATRAFPMLALAAFLADATGPLAPTASGSRGLTARAGGDVVLAVAQAEAFCGEVSAFVTAALNGVFEANDDLPPWLAKVIELYAPQYKDDPGLFRRTVGAIALMIYATTLARPWSLSLTADPLAVAYGVAGGDAVEGEVDLTVWQGQNVFDDDIAACNELSEAQLTSSPVGGSTLIWDTTGLAPHAQPTTAIGSVGDDGTASLSYVTMTESADAAQSGDPVTAEMRVSVAVERPEIDNLGDVVEAIVLGEAAGSPLGSAAKAQYLAMRPKLDALALPSAFTTIDVTYHTAPASPSPTGGPIAGTWTGTWAGITYPDTAGTFTVTFSQSGDQLGGPITITDTPCLTGGLITGTINGNVIEFGAVQGEVTVLYDGIVTGSTMSGSWATDCGESVGTWQATR